jgi:flagellar basal body rod protein FlgC
MDAASNASSIAAAGLYAAQVQVGVAASNIANSQDGTGAANGVTAPFGSSAVVAVPTGTQPGGVSGNAFNTLQTSLTAQPDGGVKASVSGQPNQPDDPTQQLTNLLIAQQTFDANVASLKASNLFNQVAINIVT